MYVFPVVKNACNDRSWRVRHAVAKNYPTIALALQCSGDLVDQMVGCFLGLLQDTEAEVRGAAASNIAKVRRSEDEAQRRGCVALAPRIKNILN